MSLDLVGLTLMFVRDHIAGIAGIADIAVMSVVLVFYLHSLFTFL